MTRFVLIIALLGVALIPVSAHIDKYPSAALNCLVDHQALGEPCDKYIAHFEPMPGLTIIEGDEVPNNLLKDAVKLLLADTIFDKTLTSDIDATEMYASSTYYVDSYRYTYKVLIRDEWKVVSKKEYGLFIESEQKAQAERIAAMKALLSKLNQ